MRDEPPTSGRRASRALRWAERVLIGAGAAMLVWAALQVADARVSQQLAREAMAATPRMTVASATSATSLASSRPVAVSRGTPIGELSIPRVHLSAMVLHGSDITTLRRGPGHIEHTAFPGEAGNVAIAGHRDSFFRPIRDVHVGDDIFLDTAEGRFQYRVSSLGVVGSHDMSVLDATAASTLTLITCYPFWLAGPAPDRFVVRATEVARPAGPTAATSQDSTTPVVVQPVRADAGDEELVRQAIERFRVTYNARRARRPDLREEGPLAFSGCDVVLRRHGATAMCEDTSPSPGSVGVWIFTLRMGHDAWDIASVEPR